MNEEYNLKLVLQAQNDASKVLEKVSSDVKEMKSTVDNASKSVSGLTGKERAIKLRTNSAELKKELEDIRTQILNLENSDRTPENIAQLQQLRKEYVNVQEQIRNNAKALGDLGNNAKASTSLISGLITKLGGIGIAYKVVNGLVDKFNEFQQSQKELVIATGMTGEALKNLSNDMLSVQGSVNQSQKEIAQAIGEVNTRLGLQGEELQKITTNFLKFATATGQDGKQAVADNVKLFNSWSIATSEQSKYLDMLAYAGQRTGINVQQLSSNLQQNSATLQQMGFSLTDAISLLSQFEQQGVEASSTLQAMKIGITNLVKDGIAPSDAWNTLISNIQNAKNDTEGLNLACEYFGQRGGISMFKAIKSGTLDIKSMNGELENSIGTVERTTEAMETLGEFLSRKRNGVIADFVQWNNEGFRAVRELGNIISDELGPKIEQAEEFFSSWGKGIKYLIQGNADLVVESGRVSIVLNEQGKIMEEAREKAIALANAEEQARQVQEEYEQSADLLNKALSTFDSLQIDDSTTRSEFEASKTSALQLADAFQKALLSKLALAKSDFASAMNSGDKEALATARQNVSELQDEYAKLQSVIKQVNTAKYSGSGGSGGGSSGSSSGTSKANKEAEEYAKAREKEFIAMQKAHKEYVKQKQKEETAFYKQVDKEANENLKKQAKVLEDLEKEYKDKFDDITDSIKKAQKEITNLNKDIEDITTKLADITKGENSSLAEEFLNAKNIIKDLEREFEGISDIARGISRDELNDAIDTDFIGGYAVENIKKIKTALEEVNTLYDGLSDEQSDALRQEIEYQKWYNGLNRVDQIKEDYKVQREKAQEEYQSKMQELEDEQSKLAELIEQRDKLSADYLQQIEDEWNKYNDMYNDIITFENTYQKIFDDDVVKQKKAIRELKEMREEVARARAKAGATGSSIEGRATGGSVYRNTPYIVGEEGPELFVPKSNGNIVPNNEITNNNGITINMNGMSVRSDADINAITDEIIRKIKLEKSFGIS